MKHTILTESIQNACPSSTRSIAILDTVYSILNETESGFTPAQQEKCLNIISKILFDAEKTNDDIWAHSIHEKGLCDTIFMDFGTTLIQRNRNVLICSAALFTHRLIRSGNEIEAAASGGPKYHFKASVYEELERVVRPYGSLPICLMPLCDGIHWGYVLVVPHANGRATVIWGDSYGIKAPKGVLNCVRAYFSLIYREAQFTIDSRNHMIDCMKFACQQDSFSCGYYVISAMAKFCAGFNDGGPKAPSFEVYSPLTTEQIRKRVTKRALRMIASRMGTLSVAKSVEVAIQQMQLHSKPRVPFVVENPIFRPTYTICTDIESAIKEKSRDGGIDLDDDSSPVVIAPPGIYNSCDVAAGCFTMPITSGNNIVRKQVWSFADVVDNRTFLIDMRERPRNVTRPQKKPIVTAIPSTLRRRVKEKLTVEVSESISIFPAHDSHRTLSEDMFMPYQGHTRRFYAPASVSDATTGLNKHDGAFSTLPVVTRNSLKERKSCKQDLSLVHGDDQLMSKPTEIYIHTPSTFQGDSHDTVGNNTDTIQQTGDSSGLIPEQNVRVSTPVEAVAEVKRTVKGSEIHQGISEVPADFVPIKCNFFMYLHAVYKQRHPMSSAIARFYLRNTLVVKCRFRCKYYRKANKCNAQLVTRLHENGTWDAVFFSIHNHDNLPKLNTSSVIRDVSRFYRSMKEHHHSLKQAFQEWVEGLSEEEKGFVPTDLLSGEVLGSTTAAFEDTTLDEGTDVQLDETIPGYNQREADYLCVKEGVRAYLNTVRRDTVASDITCDLKHVMASFGYEGKIRNSGFVRDHCHLLKSVDFRCTEKNETCPFRLTMKRTVGAESETSGPVQGNVYSFQFHAWHDHNGTRERLKKTLPANIWNEAVKLKDTSMLPTELIIRHLEDKYDMILCRDTIRDKLRYEMRKRYPRDDDCKSMLGALFNMHRRDPGLFVRVQTDGPTKLRAVCWGQSDWLESYYKFGVVPGVSLDAKAIANRYNTPFISFGGRDNNGKNLVFFVGFIPNERQESMSWFVQSFLEFCSIAPNMVCCDQDWAILGALEIEMPDSLVILDEWHINQNQRRNCLREANSRREQWVDMENPTAVGAATFEDPMVTEDPVPEPLIDEAETRTEFSALTAEALSKALFKLRRSKSPMQFLERRNALEGRFFSDGVLPSWYKTLYYNKKDLVVRCFNRFKRGYTFKFQGSGYIESINSIYKRMVQQRGVPMSRVPDELHRYFLKKHIEDEEKLRKIQFNQRAHMILFKSIGFEEERWAEIAKRYTNYALKLVVEEAIPWSSNYSVRLLTRETDTANELEFMVFRLNSEHEGHTVKLERTYEQREARPRCNCYWFSNYGLPCSHIIRVCILVSRETQERIAVDFGSCFHFYWRREGGGWRLGEELYQSADTNSAIVEEIDTHETQLVRQERERHTLWANGRNTWNYIHRMVAGKGLKALKDLDRVMAIFANEVNRSTSGDDLNVVALFRRLSSAVEHAFERPQEMLLTEQNISRVTNSNIGNPRGRGSQKRTRSTFEKRSMKKEQRKKRR